MCGFNNCLYESSIKKIQMFSAYKWNPLSQFSGLNISI